jgi:hypothetical protein
MVVMTVVGGALIGLEAGDRKRTVTDAGNVPANRQKQRDRC